LEDVIAMLKEE